MKNVNKLTVLITDLIDAKNIKQCDMAEALGFEKPNIITMFKDGTTKVPFNRVPSIAKYLGYDVKKMLDLWFEVYAPDDFAIIQKYMLPAPKSELSANEMKIIRAVRLLTSYKEPEFEGNRSQVFALKTFTDTLTA